MGERVRGEVGLGVPGAKLQPSIRKFVSEIAIDFRRIHGQTNAGLSRRTRPDLSKTRHSFTLLMNRRTGHPVCLHIYSLPRDLSRFIASMREYFGKFSPRGLRVTHIMFNLLKNPKGIQSISPGLPSLRGYPGRWIVKTVFNPERVVSNRLGRRNPVGVGGLSSLKPKASPDNPCAQSIYECPPPRTDDPRGRSHRTTRRWCAKPGSAPYPR